jgi:hypothetical protein
LIRSRLEIFFGGGSIITISSMSLIAWFLL